MHRRRIKDTKQAFRSQAKLKTSLPVLYIDPIKNFPHYIADCTDAERLVYNILVKCSFLFKRMFMGQEAIARMAGVCLKTVSRALKKFHRAGLLMKIGRHETTCIYKLPTFIFEQSIRYQLSYLLPALQFVALTLLFSTSNNLSISKNNCQSGSCLTSNSSSFTKAKLTVTDTVFSNRLNTERERKIQKGKVGDEVYGANEPSLEEMLPKAVQNFSSIQLTNAGKVWLSVFPDDVLRDVNKKLASSFDVREPFGLAFSLALAECKKRGIQLDWKKRNSLAEHFHVSDNSVMYENYVPLSKPITSPVEKSSFGAKSRGSQSSFQGSSQDNIRYNSAHSSMTKNESKKIVPEDPREELEKYEKLYQANPNEFLAILIKEMKKNLEPTCI